MASTDKKTTLVWDAPGSHFYETGLSKGVFYPQDSKGKYPKGIVWNGLTSLTESPSGAEVSDLYADDIKYATLRSAETFGATIEAYTYPVEFAACDGSAEVVAGVSIGQQSRAPFGMSYVTQVGNDVGSEADDGYKIHIIYNATVSPSDRAYSTINDSPEAITFSWELTTTAANAGNGFKPCSTIVIDSAKLDEAKLTAIEKALYGDGTSTAFLPTADELIAFLKGDSTELKAPVEG